MGQGRQGDEGRQEVRMVGLGKEMVAWQRAEVRGRRRRGARGKAWDRGEGGKMSNVQP